MDLPLSFKFINLRKQYKTTDFSNHEKSVKFVRTLTMNSRIMQKIFSG